jgi:hypothetical protein
MPSSKNNKPTASTTTVITFKSISRKKKIRPVSKKKNDHNRLKQELMSLRAERDELVRLVEKITDAAREIKRREVDTRKRMRNALLTYGYSLTLLKDIMHNMDLSVGCSAYMPIPTGDRSTPARK